MAGLTFGFWSLRSLWWAAVASSVEQVAVGSLGGRNEAVELSGRARVWPSGLLSSVTVGKSDRTDSGQYNRNPPINNDLSGNIQSVPLSRKVISK
jgi:hypothetical protein